MRSCNSSVNCSNERNALFNKNGYDVFDCKKCLRRFSELEDVENHLSKVYSDDYFFNGKDGYPNYLDEKEILIKYGEKYAKIISHFTLPGNVLDVGSAAGFILKGIESQGWNCFGIEPNATMAAYAKNELHLNIHIGDMETYAPDIKFDLISLIQVIGHFFNLDKAIKNIYNLSNAKGLVLVESWNMNSLYSRAMGTHWHEYSPPSVVNWFSNKSINRLFVEHGFKLIGSGYPLKRINLKHAVSLIGNNTSDFRFKRQLLGFLQQSVGKIVLIYPPFDLKWYVFQKVPQFS